MSFQKEHDGIEYTYKWLDLIQYRDFWIARWEVINSEGKVVWLYEKKVEGLFPAFNEETLDGYIS